MEYDEQKYIICDFCGVRFKNHIDNYSLCRHCGKKACPGCAEDFTDGICADCYEEAEE